ncbi:MAG: hypothetical protein ACUVTL_05950 [Thermoproteota archaeon]
MEFVEAYRLASSAPIRSLDSIHMAAVNMMVRQGRVVEYFITCDQGVLERREELKKVVDVLIVSPVEIVKTLNLSTAAWWQKKQY